MLPKDRGRRARVTNHSQKQAHSSQNCQHLLSIQRPVLRTAHPPDVRSQRKLTERTAVETTLPAEGTSESVMQRRQRVLPKTPPCKTTRPHATMVCRSRYNKVFLDKPNLQFASAWYRRNCINHSISKFFRYNNVSGVEVTIAETF